MAPPSQADILKKKSFPQAPLVKKWFQKTVSGFRNPEDRFVPSKDGKDVCDRTTGNIFEQDPNSAIRGGSRNFAGAVDFCATLDKGQGRIYELPSVQQMVSELDYTQDSPALTPGVFSNVLSSLYWTATTCAGHPDLARGVLLSMAS